MTYLNTSTVDSTMVLQVCPLFDETEN